MIARRRSPWETDDAYVLEVELPGVSKQDVEVEVAGRRLTVSGRRAAAARPPW
ncbi:MAG TPA: Hsp20/alpha crystallin family protein [Egibacteraceae bacterium]|nr:Hsp20/alpha crystallin family protein [Egibacteraceae bacterium]